MEVVALCAWQFGGPAMMSSWGAEAYKRDGKVVLEALPVRLAYAPDPDNPVPLPEIPPPPLRSPEAMLADAERRQSPPPAWVRFLLPHPQVSSTWTALYDAVVEGGTVEPRIKQLLRALVAELVDCPEWAPATSPTLVAAGVGDRERQALRAFNLDGFSQREQAALRYAEALLNQGRIDDATFDDFRAQFSEAEIVELGFAVAVQNGASRVLRSLSRRPE